MKRLLPVLFFLHTGWLFGQTIQITNAKFKTGDNTSWSQPGFDDSKWVTVQTTRTWEEQGFKDYNGYAWYRMHIKIASFLKDNAWWKDSLRIDLAKIDDADEVYLNGILIGKKGSFPNQPGGYNTAWDEEREYRISTGNPAIKWDADNIIAVKVYDGGGPGGIYGNTPYINMMELVDGIKLDFRPSQVNANNKLSISIVVTNLINQPVTGTLKIKVTDSETDKVIYAKDKTATVSLDKNLVADLSGLPLNKRLDIVVDFIEKNTAKMVSVRKVTLYILTPPVSSSPKINGAKIFGVRPGSPFLYKIAATGEKPLQYAIEDLPPGLQVDASTGIITGTLAKAGDYTMNITVKNKSGEAKREFKVRCGNLLALTPPMGWNSWNCWGLSVSDEKLKSSARAMIDKGLIDHGWTYMNIDDGWEAEKRNAKGEILANSKFPDMKALGNWLHEKGLKFGIYSSPGPKTCGGYLGSYKFEKQDALTYTNWGIDYLKYDWCSYGDIAKKDTTLAAYQKPYKVMQAALRSSKRDIVYSLCQYGMKEVWKWGHVVDGNCWRTTGDITDTWKSLSSIGFNQTVQYAYAQPGRWNDPDMLIVGEVGWGENLHATRLNPDEQYTHISLWCLLSAPLLIGCDISKLDDFTLNLLTNDEVLAVDQDPLGKQAQPLIKNIDYQVWVKELEDGSKAIGIFNLSDDHRQITINWNELGLPDKCKVRDLWRQKDLGSFKESFTGKVVTHGVTLLKVSE